jgi:hypothetical protein
MVRRRESWLAVAAVLVAAVLVISRAATSVPASSLASQPASLVPPLTFGPSPLESVAAPSDATTSTPDETADEATASPIGSVPTETTKATSHPTPTLDWENIGYMVGAKSPVALGAKAKVTIQAPVGPICSLTGHYPSGGSAAVGSPAHPKAGAWVWSWTVPSSAGVGTATMKVKCTYQGLAKPGDASFDLVAAAPSPTPKATWSMQVTTAPIFYSNSDAPVFHVHISGTFPKPDLSPFASAGFTFSLGCSTSGWEKNGGTEFYPEDKGFDIKLSSYTPGWVAAVNVGTCSWIVNVESSYFGTIRRTDTGTFVVSADPSPAPP